MKSAMLELLGCLEATLNSAYYTQEAALGDLYDSRGLFTADTPFSTAFAILQKQTNMSGGDLLVLLFDGGPVEEVSHDCGTTP